ncbi:DUF6615 family protein [Oceanococcus atlanticus]|uniref:DUF6615 family protein n=1 Tax=Oceanococcus atlanticus TaxID=1317117 RepID=UPI0011BAC358|nr:DUF6615 family protein [Oceanococcus atlanticus]
MDTADLFDALASTTWRAIGRAFDRRIQIGEDAITTYNLMTIDAASQGRAVIVEDTRVVEHMKGCDWEFWIGSDLSGWRRYAIQAKRISVSDGRYQSLGHKVRGVPQIDILDRYAAHNRAKPLYCFYNYGESRPIRWNCNLPNSYEILGCSITPSHVVRTALNTRGGRCFEYIHSQSETLPWSCLIRCPLSNIPPPPGSRAIAHFYERLPDNIARLREERDPEALIEFDRPSSNENVGPPRWVGVIDRGPRDDG